MTRRSRFWRCPVCGRRMVPEVDTGTATETTPTAADVASVKANTTATLVSTTKATQVATAGKNDEAVGKVANALADEGKAASVPAASPDTSTTEKEA